MSVKKVNVKELKIGPIRQSILPEGFIERVRKMKETLDEVEPSSLEVTVSNFQRDREPDMELELWEAIAKAYKANMDSNPNWSLSKKRNLFRELLEATF